MNSFLDIFYSVLVLPPRNVLHCIGLAPIKVVGNDEVTIMEALEITSEELVERFADKVNTNSWKFDLEEECEH